MPPAASSFDELCAVAERDGERVGLHVGKLRGRSRPDGSVLYWREITAISVTRRGRGNHVQRVTGVEDLERGAAELLRRLS